MMQRLTQTDDSYSALIARLALGIVMFPHGAQKLLGWWGGSGFSGTLDAFSQYFGIPAVLTVLVILAEFFGSLGLIFGFLTRVSAFGVLSVMLGAIFLSHLQHGFFMNWTGNQEGQGIEYHLLAIGLALALMVSGGGALSVDRALASRR